MNPNCIIKDSYVMTQFIIIFVFLAGYNIISRANSDPNIIETVVVTEENETIALNWTMAKQTLANKYLPVWIIAWNGKIFPSKRDVMRKIGPFSTYYDLKQSSAVVFVHQWNCIFGIIDVRYQIVCLPLSDLGHYHKIGQSPYVMILGVDEFANHTKTDSIASWKSDDSLDKCAPESDNFTMHIATLANPDDIPTHLHLQSRCQHNRIDPMPSTSHENVHKYIEHLAEARYEDKKIIAYPEVLILISHEIARSTKEFTTLILRYIVQFNAVAMLFAKLAKYDIEIYINIAGIVIDRCKHSFPSGVLFQQGQPSGDLILKEMSDYLIKLKEGNKFSKPLLTFDMIDMFILSTTNEWKERNANPGGMSTSVHDIILDRVEHLARYSKKFLGAVVDSTNFVQHYVNVAREIAHLMTVEDDSSRSTSSCCNGEQCYGIMQVGERHCPNCLTWSPQSVISFKRFLSKHTNRCFLRNKPRSLHHPDTHLPTLYPADQCLCYGYMPATDIVHVYSYRGITACRLPLRCLYPYSASPKTMPIPIDGTPCIVPTSNVTMVCWRKICTPS